MRGLADGVPAAQEQMAEIVSPASQSSAHNPVQLGQRLVERWRRATDKYLPYTVPASAPAPVPAASRIEVITQSRLPIRPQPPPLSSLACAERAAARRLQIRANATGANAALSRARHQRALSQNLGKKQRASSEGFVGGLAAVTEAREKGGTKSDAPIPDSWEIKVSSKQNVALQSDSSPHSRS